MDRGRQRADPLLGDSLMVEPRTLTPLVPVRIWVPQPTCIIRPIDHQVEGRTQGKFKLFSPQMEVRKDKSDQLPLLLDVRTLKNKTDQVSHGQFDRLAYQR